MSKFPLMTYPKRIWPSPPFIKGDMINFNTVAILPKPNPPLPIFMLFSFTSLQISFFLRFIFFFSCVCVWVYMMMIRKIKIFFYILILVDSTTEMKKGKKKNLLKYLNTFLFLYTMRWQSALIHKSFCKYRQIGFLIKKKSLSQ